MMEKLSDADAMALVAKTDFQTSKGYYTNDVVWVGETDGHLIRISNDVVLIHKIGFNDIIEYHNKFSNLIAARG